jgi:hypothetical protein
MTEPGIPLAGLPIDIAPLLERVTQEGVLGHPRRADRPDAEGVVRAQATDPVSELISEQRR